MLDQSRTSIKSYKRTRGCSISYNRSMGAAEKVCVYSQAHWRGRGARRQLAVLQAVVRMQALVRGSTARRVLAARGAAAVTLQAGWRCHSRRQQYMRLQAAAVVVRCRLWRTRIYVAD